MEEIKLKDILRRKNYDDSPNKRRWKFKVLHPENHKQKVTESKETRRRLERSLDGAREVISTFASFQDEYGQAIGRLKKRIEDEEKASEKAKEVEDQEENEATTNANTNTEASDKSIDYLHPCHVTTSDSKTNKLRKFYDNNPNLRRPKRPAHSSKALPTSTLGVFKF